MLGVLKTQGKYPYNSGRAVQRYSITASRGGNIMHAYQLWILYFLWENHKTLLYDIGCKYVIYVYEQSLLQIQWCHPFTVWVIFSGSSATLYQSMLSWFMMSKRFRITQKHRRYEWKAFISFGNFHSLKFFKT